MALKAVLTKIRPKAEFLRCGAWVSNWHSCSVRAAARHVRERCHIHRADTVAGPGEDDPKRSSAVRQFAADRTGVTWAFKSLKWFNRFRIASWISSAPDCSSRAVLGAIQESDDCKSTFDPSSKAWPPI